MARKLKSDGKTTFPKVSKMTDKELRYALILKSEMAATEALRKFLENCESERRRRNAVKNQ